MMQRAMKLKQKKNLETVKGNPFSTLQFNNLDQIALDVNLKFGYNSAKSKLIISNQIRDDRKNYDNFIEENPDILLPVNLDLESVQKLMLAMMLTMDCRIPLNHLLKMMFLLPFGLRW
jgi:hypothetical protein